MGAWAVPIPLFLLTEAVRPSQLLFMAFAVFFLWRSWISAQPSQEAEQLARQKGCAPPKAWNAKWPLGLDMLFKAVKHSREIYVLKSMIGVTDASGTTFVQYLLDARGILTIDPANIEVVLSSNFEGFGLGVYFFMLATLVSTTFVSATPCQHPLQATHLLTVLHHLGSSSGPRGGRGSQPVL